MAYRITVLPQQQHIEAAAGETLLQALRRAGLAPDAPCGGTGRCGKCRVWLDGKEVPACQTAVDRDMEITLPRMGPRQILTADVPAQAEASPLRAGFFLAFDIGTTTVAGHFLRPDGLLLATASAPNPQAAFGADVISRIQQALKGQLDAQTAAIRQCVAALAGALCAQAGIAPAQVGTISIVGNPAMQQLFLGISPENLATIPFAPVLTEGKAVDAVTYLPGFGNALLLIVPNLSGFVGADTLAGVLATGLHTQEQLTLFVDIGTNGEMVLGSRHRLVACSTAAGPALEGAGIHFGMGGQAGAIDHVWLEQGQVCHSVIGGGTAVGICGSGLIDAVAVALDLGLINERGRMATEDRLFHITDNIYLTQEDIRQVQLAKGAIAAGIQLMAAHLGVAVSDIQRLTLAGAFGTYMNPASACRIGLLPSELAEKIEAVGNAAGSGAMLLALSGQALQAAERLTRQIEYLELSVVPGFQRSFAQQMRFQNAVAYWMEKALALGFTTAVPLNVSMLKPREDVRAMCSADKCGAYGKNWTCPPHCGSLSQCQTTLQQYRRGILLQTVGQLRKTIDTKAYRQTEQQHLQQFHALAAHLRQRHPNALCLGSGGCRICNVCAWPEACRFPERACASMEGYGLFVTQVCRDHGCPYHHGEKTITYTACILF